MLGKDQCSSCNTKEQFCKDGFIQVALCKGIEGNQQSYCLRDELPLHFINEDGSPRFYKLNNKE